MRGPGRIVTPVFWLSVLVSLCIVFVYHGTPKRRSACELEGNDSDSKEKYRCLTGNLPAGDWRDRDSNVSLMKRPPWTQIFEKRCSQAPWLLQYTKLHRDILKGEPGVERRFLYLNCSDIPGHTNPCGGIGNRLYTIWSLTYLAFLSKRALIISWPDPVDISTYWEPNEIDWRYRSDLWPGRPLPPFLGPNTRPRLLKWCDSIREDQRPVIYSPRMLPFLFKYFFFRNPERMRELGFLSMPWIYDGGCIHGFLFKKSQVLEDLLSQTIDRWRNSYAIAIHHRSKKSPSIDVNLLLHCARITEDSLATSTHTPLPVSWLFATDSAEDLDEVLAQDCWSKVLDLRSHGKIELIYNSHNDVSVLERSLVEWELLRTADDVVHGLVSSFSASAIIAGFRPWSGMDPHSPSLCTVARPGLDYLHPDSVAPGESWDIWIEQRPFGGWKSGSVLDGEPLLRTRARPSPPPPPPPPPPPVMPQFKNLWPWATTAETSDNTTAASPTAVGSP